MPSDTLKPSGVIIPFGICLLKVNNRNIRPRCEICTKLTIKAPERGHFEHETDGWDVALTTRIGAKRVKKQSRPYFIRAIFYCGVLKGPIDLNQ